MESTVPDIHRKRYKVPNLFPPETTACIFFLYIFFFYTRVGWWWGKNKETETKWLRFQILPGLRWHRMLWGGPWAWVETIAFGSSVRMLTPCTVVNNGVPSPCWWSWILLESSLNKTWGTSQYQYSSMASSSALPPGWCCLSSYPHCFWQWPVRWNCEGRGTPFPPQVAFSHGAISQQ